MNPIWRDRSPSHRWLRRCPSLCRAWVAVVGCAVLLARPVGAAPMAATVNGVGISLALLERSTDTFLGQQPEGAPAADAKRRDTVRRRVLDLLIFQELLWQEAERTGKVAPEEEVERALGQMVATLPSRDDYLRRLRETGFTEASYREDLKKRLSANLYIEEVIAPAVTVSDQEVHDYYAANRARFKKGEEVRVRQILIKAEPASGPAARTAARKRLEMLRDQARAGADFAALAHDHSQGPAVSSGGDLGFFGRGRTYAPFEEVAFALEPGQVSDVVETPDGYHLIKVEERRSGALATEAEAREEIHRYLLAIKTRQAVAERVEQLRAAGTVDVLIR